MMNRRRSLMMAEQDGPLAVYYRGTVATSAGIIEKRGYNTYGTANVEADHLYFSCRRTTTTNCCGALATTMAIDLSKYSRIKIVGSNTGTALLPSNGEFRLVLADNIVNGSTLADAYGSSTEHIRASITNTGNYEYLLEIPDSRKKRQYIGLYAEEWTQQKTLIMSVYEIWLE